VVTRRSPQTERIIDLINLLTVDPSGQGVTISELARRLGVSKATCYPMLEALTSAGFLIRNASRKTYHLGPALIAAGNAASRRAPTLELAREAMLWLGLELQRSAWLYQVDGTHLRVIDQAWQPRDGTPPIRVGEQYAAIPPRGAAFVAWATPKQIESWLDRASVSPEERVRYLAQLATIRADGYAVTLQETPVDQLRELAAQLANAPGPVERSQLVDRMAPQLAMGPGALLCAPTHDRQYSVNSIDAPIFTGSGEITLALGLTNLSSISGREIIELAEQVKKSANAITDCARGPQ
jgi:DNA-binding IclR family transcriptional regulator